MWRCSGVVEAGSFALNANKGKKERIGRLLQMHANSREDVKIARAGDIVAIAGLKDVITGETLCDEKAPIVLERMEFPGIALVVVVPSFPHACGCYLFPRGDKIDDLQKKEKKKKKGGEDLVPWSPGNWPCRMIFGQGSLRLLRDLVGPPDSFL